MTAAARILVVGGAAVLLFAFLLGLAISMSRMKAPATNRYLMAAHLAGIIQAALLFGLASIIDVSALSEGVETVAAVLLVSGIALFEIGLTMNWLQRVGDQFLEKPVGWYLLSVSAPLNLAAAALVLVGLVRGVTS